MLRAGRTRIEAVPSREVLDRWPHIRRFLWVDDSTGRVDDNYTGWSSCVEGRLNPVERAAAYEEWAGFYEWCLAQRAAEVADDRRRRHLVETWTDSMAYSFRRSAAWARGDNPGTWVSQWERRPDLYAENQAIVAGIIAELDPRYRPAERLVMAG